MAKFKFIYWLLEFLQSQSDFIFDWDEGNMVKSKEKHGVTIQMVESCFLDNNLLALGEQYHPSVDEERYGMVGKANTNEVIFICFTIREGKIRPISARFANKKERGIYEEIC
ncbi:MAG: BrnT family toxin [Bacteriovoracaceae bacterium]|nr:BrnT family toxin [Bacteriovoracaceae bacterium]